MKTAEKNKGLTLVEIIVVAGIVAVLAGIVITSAGRLSDQAKERQLRGTFEIINSALEEFGQARFTPDFSDPKWLQPGLRDRAAFYRELVYPIDCNDFSRSELQDELSDILNRNITITGGQFETEYAGSSALYFMLNYMPQSRAILARLDDSMITNLGSNGQPMYISVGNREQPLYRFIDPWNDRNAQGNFGKTIRYDYYDSQQGNISNRRETLRNFPVLTSAGPDGAFDTDKDISSID